MTTSRPGFLPIALVGLVLGWFFLVTTSYYIVHKPLSLGNALAILSVFGDLIVVSLIFLIASALGRFLTHTISFESALEGLVIFAGLGLGVIALASFALGLAGALTPVVFWFAFVVSLLLLRREFAVSLRELLPVKIQVESRFERFLALFVCATLILAIVRALTPPIAWDAQLYHLEVGKFWIAQGRISAPPDNPLFSYPALVESLYMGALLLKGDTVAQLIHWGYFVLTLGTAFLLARRFFSRRVAWISLAVMAAVPSFVLVATWAYADAALTFYATAALYCVIRGADLSEVSRPLASVGGSVLPANEAEPHGRSRTAWFLLAGVLAGFALGVKYTAVVVPLALVVVIMMQGVNRGRLRDVLLLSIPAAIIASPWYLRNWFFQGNPVYPFVFGGPFWDSFRAEQFSRLGSGLAHDPIRLLLAPWEATVLGQEGAVGYEATIGPLLLLLLPLILVAVRQTSRVLRPLLVFSGILYGVWLLGLAESKLLWQSRLLFPAFPALAIAAGTGLETLSDFRLPQFSLSRFARLLTGIVLGLTLLGQTLDLISLDPFSYLTGFQTRNEYLAERLTPIGYYDAMRSLAPLPATSKVLFLWEPRSYYADTAAKVVPDALLDRFGDLVFRYGEPESILSYLRAQGYTHILLNRSGLNYYASTQYDPITPRQVATLDQLLAQDFRLVSSADSGEHQAGSSVSQNLVGGYELYEIRGVSVK